MGRTKDTDTKFSEVQSLSFSPDGQNLAVVKFDARDANVPFKFYLADACRTVSVVDVPKGRVSHVIEQAKKPGNQGPGFHLDGRFGDSVAFDADGTSLLLLEFG